MNDVAATEVHQSTVGAQALQRKKLETAQQWKRRVYQRRLENRPPEDEAAFMETGHAMTGDREDVSVEPAQFTTDWWLDRAGTETLKVRLHGDLSASNLLFGPRLSALTLKKLRATTMRLSDLAISEAEARPLRIVSLDWDQVVADAAARDPIEEAPQRALIRVAPENSPDTTDSVPERIVAPDNGAMLAPWRILLACAIPGAVTGGGILLFIGGVVTHPIVPNPYVGLFTFLLGVGLVITAILALREAQAEGQ